MTDMTAEWFAAHDFWQLGKADDGRAMLLVTEDEYNAIRQALTAPDVAKLVEALEEARLTLEVMQGRGSSVKLTLEIIDRALVAHRKQGDQS